MHYQVLKGLLIAAHLLFAASATGIDSKIDFGGSSSSSLRSENRGNRHTFTPFKYNKIIKTSSDDFDDIGVVCTSGGCNTTEKSDSNNGDSIQTDILVHVQTKVDFNQNKTQSVGETPDVPIVVGYGGSQLDATLDDDRSHSLGPQSIFVPDVPEVPSYNSGFSPLDFDSSFNPSDTPLAGSKIVPGNSFGGISPPIASRIDSFGGSFDNFNPSAKVPGFYVTKSPVASRVDYVGRSFENLDPAAKAGFYPSNGDSGFNISIKPFSSVSNTASGSENDGKFNENGIEIKVPYFHHQSHYHGERPPPQYIWYSKKNNGFNPVEFKTVKSTWTPSLWNRRVVPHMHSGNVGGGVKCSCKEEPGSNTEPRWYPSANTGVPSINDPGSQINDKLAPLN